MRFFLTILFFSFVVKLNAQSFKVFADDNRVEVFEQNDVPLNLGLSAYKYVRIPYSGRPISIKIESSGFAFDASDWSISPKRNKIKGVKSGNQLSFSVNRLGYVVIRFKPNQDFTKRIVLLFEPPEIIPGKSVNIVDVYGVDNSGKKNETIKIQKALDDISGSGKVLYFPSGIYKTFKLQFRSNSRIHLSKNARILADADSLSSYLSNDETEINHFLLIKDVENLTISGLGILDGNGTQIVAVEHKEQSKQMGGIRLLLIYRSKNIHFEGILLKDAARWNTHILNSQHIRFRYCKLMNNPVENEYLGSLDGWDPDSSSDVLIENSFGWAGDDTVAIKCTGRGSSPERVVNVERIYVRNNVFLTKKSGLKIGTETFCSLMQNMVFEGNDIIESDRVMGINVRDGAVVKDILFKNNYAEFFYPDRKQMGMNFYITKRDLNTSILGKIQNVIVEDCSFETAFPKKMAFFRHFSETERNDLSVYFKNLFIGGRKIQELTPEFFDLSKNNSDLNFN
jgi:hypothetical protein